MSPVVVLKRLFTLFCLGAINMTIVLNLQSLSLIICSALSLYFQWSFIFDLSFFTCFLRSNFIFFLSLAQLFISPNSLSLSNQQTLLNGILSRYSKCLLDNAIRKIDEQLYWLAQLLANLPPWKSDHWKKVHCPLTHNENIKSIPPSF